MCAYSAFILNATRCITRFIMPVNNSYSFLESDDFVQGKGLLWGLRKYFCQESLS